MKLSSDEKLPFLSLASYHSSNVDFRKRILSVKKGHLPTIKRFIEHIALENKDYFFKDSVLVPIPSSQKYNPENLWIPKLICDELIASGYGTSTEIALIRHVTIEKQHFKKPSERMLYKEHMETITINSVIGLDSKNIILVDDVLTKGSTSAACYKLLIRSFPDCQIKLFTLARVNKSDKFIDPIESHISIFNSGNTFRNGDQKENSSIDWL